MIMTKEQMIKAIYEKIADKTLSFGCKIQKRVCGRIFNLISYDKGCFSPFNLDGQFLGLKSQQVKIIGHPVMIGRCDVLIEKGPNYFDEWIEILDLWEKKDEPIENQSEKCIAKIYNLIK